MCSCVMPFRPVFDKGLAQLMITVLKPQVKMIFDLMLHNVLSLSLALSLWLLPKGSALAETVGLTHKATSLMVYAATAMMI